ncbi:MAG: D-alanine--D-alanine ligase [Micromonosporaceae bacterium]|nr:D-alanine--D-alanine ligase [Micromonosporaceae bacterium]
MTGRLRVAVIGGGRNCEHEVSLASAASAYAALDRDRYQPVALTIGRDGGWLVDGRAADLLAAIAVLRGCDVVLPLVHGVRGEDGSLAALCEFAGVPYVGSGVGAGALGMDKWATKLVAASVGVATAPGYLVSGADEPGRPWTGPVVVKPVRAGSSHGVALVADRAALSPAVAAALRPGDRVLVEQVVAGREIDIAVLGSPAGPPVVSPALEIAVDGVFDYAAKYGGGAEFRVPARLPGYRRRELAEQAVAVYQALGCAGVARVDFFLTADGWVFNEVNTAPGLTEQSQVPRMFAAAGLGYSQLLDRMIVTALAGPGDRW